MLDEEVKKYKKINHIQTVLTVAFMFCVFFAMIITILMVSIMNNAISSGTLFPINILVHLEIIICCIMMVLFISYLICENKSKNNFNNKIATISVEELDNLMETIKEQEQKINKQWHVIDQLEKKGKKKPKNY